MANQFPTAAFVDGDFTTPQPIGIPEPISPVPSFADSFVFTQKFQQFLVNYLASGPTTPTAFNTKHPSAGKTPDYSNYFLVGEGRREDIGGAIVQWERTYAVKPTTHSEGASDDYEFVGFVGVWLSTTSSGFVNNVAPSIVASVTGRPKKSRTVTSRVLREYFLVAGNQYQGAWSSGTAYTISQMVSDSGVYYNCIVNVGPTATHPASDATHWAVAVTPDYSLETSIPINYAQRFFAGGGTLVNGLETNFLTDGVGSLAATFPNLTDYQGWIGNTLAYGFAADVVGNWRGPWNSLGVYAIGDGVSDIGVHYKCIAAVGPSGSHPAGDGGHWAAYHPAQMIAAESRIARWLGNIWYRSTRYVLAL